MRKRVIACTAFLSLLTALFAWAQPGRGLLDGLTYDLRIGYSVGGTMPSTMPVEIRAVTGYMLTPNLQVGIDAEKCLTDRVGLVVGLRFENKGMHTDARVKNYGMTIVQGRQQLSGRFTGGVVTRVSEWMLTVPATASLHLGHDLRLRFGPYASFLVARSFTGYAHDGYLRLGDPTGAKVDIGRGEGRRGDYDFSRDMRRLQAGLLFGLDWRFRSHLGAYFELTRGLTGLHRKGFTIIEQPLYPFYGTVGVTVRLG